MATITDVATAAGVAPSTVSYVLSGKRSISAETRRRVEESIRRLGYRRHTPKALTNLLALSVPPHADASMELVTATIRAARAHDHDLLLLTDDRLATASIADALIVLDAARLDRELPALRSLDRPVVLVGVPARPAGFTCVDLDLVGAGSACAGHLADLGHDHVALVGPAGRLLDGFSTTVARRGLRAIVRDRLDEVLRHQPNTTGLVVPDELTLVSVLAELARRGLRVPADISVVAVCPDAVATSRPIPLTAVALPVAELGAAAVDIAMSGAQPGITLLPAKLTRRASTAAPRHADALPPPGARRWQRGPATPTTAGAS
jgi:DNA-binding LacI/PurR family transcriptional regulator